jgi:hypothetical protein
MRHPQGDTPLSQAEPRDAMAWRSGHPALVREVEVMAWRSWHPASVSEAAQ